MDQLANPTSTPPVPAAVSGAVVPPPVPARREEPWRGILYVVLALFFFSCSDASSKYLTDTLSSVQVTWLRFVVFAAVMVPVAWFWGGASAFRSSRPGLQTLRSLGVLGSALLFVMGLRYLPMAEATTMGFMSPIFVTALSIPFLGERVGIRRWAAVIVGLVGVIVVVRPGGDAFDQAAIFPILSALSWAVALIVTRKMKDADHPLTTLLYPALIGCTILSVLTVFDWRNMGQTEILFGLITGLTSTIAQGLIVLAFRHAGASLLAPFFYTQLLWSAALGYFMFGSIPDGWTFVGAGIIAASGLYTAHRERVRAAQDGALQPDVR
ncbi:MAG TPA: DMT family transporter [Microvirga sp.]|nr:DMT family transporter [Microvirga sp.]